MFFALGHYFAPGGGYWQIYGQDAAIEAGDEVFIQPVGQGGAAVAWGEIYDAFADFCEGHYAQENGVFIGLCQPAQDFGIGTRFERLGNYVGV